MKTCLKCDQLLPFGSFRGERNVCKTCENASSRKHYLKIRIQAFWLYGENCQCCGEDRIEFLAIDHINGNGNKHRETFSNTIGFYRWLIELGEARPGFRTLCHNCNSAVRYGNSCPHKTNVINTVSAISNDIFKKEPKRRYYGRKTQPEMNLEIFL